VLQLTIGELLEHRIISYAEAKQARYDMEFSGPLYPFASFVRNVNLQGSK
jgi:hypothetical protein